MQAIEFETTAFQHTIRIPDIVPDGVPIRIILLFDEAIIETPSNKGHWKDLLGAMPNVGSDEDFSLPTDHDRQ